jgi:hypothetical protein
MPKRFLPSSPLHLALAAAAALGLGAPSASALTFFDTGVTGGDPSSSLIGVRLTSADAGSSFELGWTVANVVGSDDLGATGTFSVVSFSATTITLDVSITNTTVLSAALTNADLLSVGFGVSPDATASFVSAGSVFDRIGAGSGPQQTYPGGFKGIDVCVYGQNCSGGAVAQGLHAGDSDGFRIALHGDFSGGSADLLYFGAKFQTNVGSYEPGAGPAIPEPSAALVFGAGALLVSRRRWRR